jgi:hypothetical protein
MLHVFIRIGEGMDVGDVTEDWSGQGRMAMGASHGHLLPRAISPAAVTIEKGADSKQNEL